MKFSRYGAPWRTSPNRTFCCGIVISFVLNRSSAGNAPVALNQARIRSGVCMNMMKSADSFGYFVHAVILFECDVDPRRLHYFPTPHSSDLMPSTFARLSVYTP